MSVPSSNSQEYREIAELISASEAIVIEHPESFQEVRDSLASLYSLCGDQHLGDYESALHYYLQAIAINTTENQESDLSTHGKAAALVAARGDIEKATLLWDRGYARSGRGEKADVLPIYKISIEQTGLQHIQDHLDTWSANSLARDPFGNALLELRLFLLSRINRDLVRLQEEETIVLSDPELLQKLVEKCQRLIISSTVSEEAHRVLEKVLLYDCDAEVYRIQKQGVPSRAQVLPLLRRWRAQLQSAPSGQTPLILARLLWAYASLNEKEAFADTQEHFLRTIQIHQFDTLRELVRIFESLVKNGGRFTEWLTPVLSHVYVLLGHYHSSSCGGHEHPEKFDVAIAYFLKAGDLLPGKINTQLAEAYHQCGILLQFQGKQAACEEVTERVLKLQIENAKTHPIGKLGVRLNPTRTGALTNIGNGTSEPEFYVKSGAIGWRPPFRSAILAPSVVNPTAFRYWRRHLCAVTDESLVRRLSPLKNEIEHNTFWHFLPEGKMVMSWSGMIAIQKEWEQQGRAPLLKLLSSDRERGWDAMEKLGVPRGSWFVALHVREQRINVNGELKQTYNAHRDAGIASYIPLMKKIHERGGWVIRMGDTSMTPLPKIPGVVDYVFTQHKSDWMDVFLCAESKVFIGSASGVYGVAINFGTPSLVTNISPMNAFPVCSFDIYTPKLLRRVETQKFLSFEESLADPFNYLHNTTAYHRFGVEVVDNTPEELEEAGIEILERAMGTWIVTDEDEALQAKFREHADRCEPHGIIGRCAAGFLRRYRHLL